MFPRRTSRSRVSSSRPLAAAAIELLENKQLLSGVNSADVPERTITISDPELTSDKSIWIEEAHIVDGSIWVLTSVRDTGIQILPIDIDPGFARPIQDLAVPTVVWPTVISVSSITVNASEDLPVREFRIGGDEGGEATPVDGFADFAQQMEGLDSEVLYSRVNREVSLWRESVLNQMKQQSAERYSDTFGQETENEYQYWYNELTPVFDGATVFARSLAAESVSDTNVQVAGVDEADIVETDGEYIYTLSGGQVVVLSAATETQESAVVGRTRLASSNHLAMFLHEERLTIISQDNTRIYNPFNSRSGQFWGSSYQSTNRTVVTVLDVSDPASPTLQQETVVDGSYQSARAIGSQVYVVINNTDAIPYLPAPNVVWDSESSTNYRYETREEYVSRLKRNVDRLTPPSVYHRAETENGYQTLQRLGWLDGASDEIVAEDSQLTTVLQFDANATESIPVDNISVRTARYSQSQVYASASSIYLVTNEFEQAESNGDFIRLANRNGVSKINKIDISGGRLRFDGVGSVPGSIESQFSIDEHNGYLRIITTTDQWGPESKNHVFVLEDAGDELTVVGSILDLAPTERVYSARFDGDRAWVVTFRRIDPVFSLDLSDPANPTVTGELKIPGFSEHLQLIDENHLLAIGRAATEEGRVEGVQVSLFDISDMTAPALIHQKVLNEGESGWSNSSALHDHQAFNYLAEAGLLMIPYRDQDSSGLMTLSIDIENGIEIIGEASSGISRNVLRSVQINEFLYAVAHDGVSVMAVADPGTVLYDVNFSESAETPHDHSELLREHFAAIRDRLNIREYLEENGDRIRQIEVGDLAGLVEQGVDELLEFEFSVTDIASGEELIRQVTEGPWLSLQDDGHELLEPGTYEFLVRTRSRILDSPEWNAWIESEVVTVGDDRPEMISGEVLPELQSVLEWSEIANQVRTVVEGQTESYEVNPVDHYEVWVTDATLGQMVLWDRDVEGTELDLDQLGPGLFYTWFRGVYEDGTQAAWSPRTDLQVQGRPLELLNDFVTTADALPEFSWEAITGATDFEVQITNPDGSETVYSAVDIPDARHEITEGLAAGTYTLRVRADLASGVTTEWAETEFTILDRPEVRTYGRRLDIFGADGVVEEDGSEGIEIWVNKADSYERVFHSVDWTSTENVDLVDAFGLTNQIGEYDIWMRLLGEQNSKWSQKETFEVFHDAIQTEDIGQFGVGETQEFTWESSSLVDSYELFVQKVGQSGAYLHESGIVGSSLQLTENLTAGNYKYWLRGTLADGFTRWTDAFELEVMDEVVSPALRIDGSVISWDAPTNAAQHHLWINRVDDAGRLIEARVAHVRDMTETSFDIATLGEGNFAAWVQTSVSTVDGLIESAWSERLNVDRPVVGDLVDSIIDDVIGDLLGALDVF